MDVPRICDASVASLWQFGLAPLNLASLHCCDVDETTHNTLSKLRTARHHFMPPVRMLTYVSSVEDESGSRASPAVLCCAVLCCAVPCCAVWGCAVLCCAVLCCSFVFSRTKLRDTLCACTFPIRSLVCNIMPVVMILCAILQHGRCPAVPCCVDVLFCNCK